MTRIEVDFLQQIVKYFINTKSTIVANVIIEYNPSVIINKKYISFGNYKNVKKNSIMRGPRVVENFICSLEKPRNRNPRQPRDDCTR